MKQWMSGAKPPNPQKSFALCGERPKALPLETAAFEKAGETFNFCLFYVITVLNGQNYPPYGS